MRRPAITIVLFLSLGLLWGCFSPPSSNDKVKVTASIFPLADIAASVGGDWVEVQVLIPAGASPHVFEPTPEAFRQFAKTRLFVMVGAGLEFWAQELIAAVADETPAVVRAADGVQLIQMTAHQEEGSEPHLHDHGLGNPHVWLDPMVAISLAENIGQALMHLDPEHSQEYGEHLATYQEQLRALDEHIRETAGQFRIKEYVAFHPAWSYFARRYGLVEVGVIQESPGREPTPKHLQSIIRTIQDHGIRAVFAEPQFNPSAASVLASEANVRVLILDPLGGPDLPGRDSYIGLMEYNLKMIREAME